MKFITAVEDLIKVFHILQSFYNNLEPMQYLRRANYIYNSRGGAYESTSHFESFYNNLEPMQYLRRANPQITFHNSYGEVAAGAYMFFYSSKNPTLSQSFYKNLESIW